MNITREQVAQLLHAIDPNRVLRDNDGRSHVAQQDVRAHLTRIFGFGNWKKEFTGHGLRCIRDERITVPGKNNRPERKDIPAVTYICELRLFVKGQGDTWETGWDGDDVGTGTSPNLPDYGDAHDFAAKNAVSYALKRCAVDLGDQFGLSLYNRGQLEALVRGTMVWPEDGTPAADGRRQDVQQGVPPQVDLGDDRPAEQVDTSTGEVTRPAPMSEEVKALKKQVWAKAKELHIGTPQLQTDFTAFTEGAELTSAGPLQLQSFLDYLSRPVASNGAHS